MKIDIKSISSTVAGLAIIFTGFMAVETRYAKASDLDRLIRGSEQKTIWDLEENVYTSESARDRRLWFNRLKEKVAEFCAVWPEEDECTAEYLDDIEEEIEGE